MKKEELKASADDKMRIHYRKRSGKNKKSITSPPVKYEYVNADKAETTEKEFYDDAMAGVSSEDTDHIAVSTTLRKRKVVIDPERESKRRSVVAAEKSILITIIATVSIAVLVVLICYFINTKQGRRFLQIINRSKYISENGDYIFGEFENHITIGDSREKVVDMFGLPDPSPESQYFYGKSYILFQNDIVTGYHKDRSENFAVTVGYKTQNIYPEIEIGDTASLVVDKLGSPDTYHKRTWIYEDITYNFEKDVYLKRDTPDLIIEFDEDYIVIDYDFVKPK